MSYLLLLLTRRFMLYFLLTWVAAAIFLLITAYVVPGFAVNSFTTALIAAAILGLVNALVRPILIILTLPFTLLTFGLFLFVINALMLWLVGFITPGFVVTGFLPALLGSIVLTLVATVLGQLVTNVR
jgi:putative membrane protein